jgi:hypothetical protein
MTIPRQSVRKLQKFSINVFQQDTKCPQGLANKDSALSKSLVSNILN